MAVNLFLLQRLWKSRFSQTAGKTCAVLWLDVLSNNPTFYPCDFNGLIWHISALLKKASQEVFWQQNFCYLRKGKYGSALNLCICG